MKFFDHRAQALQSARHIAVEIKLVAVIQPDARIGVPKHHAVVAAKIALAGGEPFLHQITSGGGIIKPLVAQHEKTARVAGRHPLEIGTAIKFVRVI